MISAAQKNKTLKRTPNIHIDNCHAVRFPQAGISINTYCFSNAKISFYFVLVYFVS